MRTGDSFGIVFLLFIFALCEEGTAAEEAIQLDTDILEFMLPGRKAPINYYYTPFTPYSDMIEPVLRASEYGFPSSLRHTGKLPDSITFKGVWLGETPEKDSKYWYEYVSGTRGKMNVKFRIDKMVETLLGSAKAVTRRNPPRYADPSISLYGLYMASIEGGYNTIRNAWNRVHTERLRITRLRSDPLFSGSAKMREAALHAPIFHTLQHSTESLKPPPLGLLVMHGWTLLFWVTVSELNNFFESDGKPCEPHTEEAPRDLDELSATFIFHVCKIMRSDKDLAPTDIPTGFCPNPCATLPCLRVDNAVGEECFHTGQGLFISDFRCTCNPGYEWVPALGSSELGMDIPLTDEVGKCEPVDVCSTYCNLLGTRHCDVIPGTGNAVCLCKLDFMGPTCALKRNPCIELSDSAQMPGNMACNSGQGGKCLPTLGSDYYGCQCGPRWTRSLLYEFDNCLALKDQCSSVVCIRGDCISSPDGTKAYCQCPEEAFGERCEHLRGEWGQWSSWSACSPACGHGILRQRERVRSCLGEACSGGAGGRQIEVCEGNLPCADELAILGQGLEALVPQDGAYADAKPNRELQQQFTYRKRRYRLFTSLMKLLVAVLVIFAVVAAVILPIYVLLY